MLLKLFPTLSLWKHVHIWTGHWCTPKLYISKTLLTQLITNMNKNQFTYKWCDVELSSYWLTKLREKGGIYFIMLIEKLKFSRLVIRESIWDIQNLEHTSSRLNKRIWYRKKCSWWSLRIKIEYLCCNFNS